MISKLSVLKALLIKLPDRFLLPLVLCLSLQCLRLLLRILRVLENYLAFWHWYMPSLQLLCVKWGELIIRETSYVQRLLWNVLRRDMSMLYLRLRMNIVILRQLRAKNLRNIGVSSEPMLSIVHIILVTCRDWLVNLLAL